MRQLSLQAALPAAPLSPPPPSLRRLRRLRRVATQGLIVAVVLALVAWFAWAVHAGLARNGIAFDMGFLGQRAGFDLSEGYTPAAEGLRRFESSDTNGQALLAGFLNTLKASVLAIALTTVLGTLLGVARVSRNWLVRQLSFGLVEFVRNTPLLIQLVFWYFAAVLKLPALQDASVWLGGVIASQQGIFVPSVELPQSFTASSLAAAVVGNGVFLVGLFSRRWSKQLQWLGVALLLVAILLGFPVTLRVPHVDGFVVTDGYGASPEFTAMLIGLTVYTAAFIAEIVRGAIVSLPRGQWEAAAALGLSRAATFKDIVIPQVYRIVLPAFGNQYISLAKNSSLGIAIGFPDLFNVYGTVANQSGRSLEGVIVVMLTYLGLSWVISAAVNFYNRKLLLAGGTR